MTLKTKGFTLIELLVVIAIIGILSAVVLASLNTARSKGNDAAIKSNLGTVLTQSAIFYDTNLKYDTAAIAAVGTPTVAGCTGAGATSIFADANASQALAGADRAAGGTGTTYANVTKAVCGYTANMASWIAAVPLVSTPGTWWCIDSAGSSRQISAAPGAVAACPAS